MASLYKRSGSAFWWASFVNLAGKRKQKSTGLRFDVAADTRKARELCRQLSDGETRRATNEELWDSWVHRFLEQRYGDTDLSFQRYTAAWRNISVFLREKNIHIPRQLTRQHVRDFIGWRGEVHEGVYVARKNTALLEIALIRLVMHEAVQSGFASINPCQRLGIGHEPPKKKPRITDAEHQQILAALENEPEWMRVSYLIAWEQGCRFSETCLPLSDVDIARMVVRFRTKGHKLSTAEFPLSPKLVPLFRDMQVDGRILTFVMPSQSSAIWWRFFQRIGLPGHCFHSTRVSFVTRAYEAGIPRESVMRLVGHSSYAAHSVYPRLTADHSTVKSMRALLDS